jgi:hypothetical protein
VLAKDSSGTTACHDLDRPLARLVYTSVGDYVHTTQLGGVLAPDEQADVRADRPTSVSAFQQVSSGEVEWRTDPERAESALITAFPTLLQCRHSGSVAPVAACVPGLGRSAASGPARETSKRPQLHGSSSAGRERDRSGRMVSIGRCSDVANLCSTFSIGI